MPFCGTIEFSPVSSADERDRESNRGFFAQVDEA